MLSGVATPGTRDPSPPWAGGRVVLGVCGGVAAYKSVQLARDLTLLGAEVDVVLTDAARRFVAPLSFEGVTGRGALVDLFAVGAAALHVTLGRDADCVCIAPATADFIARAASGRASDLLSTVMVASDAPVVLAPAMNDRMFAHAQTRENLVTLRARGCGVVGPVTGPLAAGEGVGPGRLAAIADVADAVGRSLGSGGALVGARVLVTGGPTRERLDQVRYFGNRSSGKTGVALARAAWMRGADVTLVTGPSAVPMPSGVDVVAVESAREMRDAVLDAAPSVDAAIFSAAVSDYCPADPRGDKIRRGEMGDAWSVALAANPDVAAEAVPLMKSGSVSVGFALEVADLVPRARRKVEEKGFDLIVGNLATEPDSGFEADTNRVTIVRPDGSARELPLMGKFRVAWEVVDLVEKRLAGRGSRSA